MQLKKEVTDLALHYISRVLLLMILTAAALMDLRSMSLPVWFIASAGVCGLIFQIILGEIMWYEVLLGCLPGLMLAVVARLSGRSIGYGDAFMMVSCGFFVGIINAIWLLLISMSICALASICILIFLKMEGRTAIPFMPFMLSGYICLNAFI